MTALVSLLFIAMIPIDCKITNFPANRHLRSSGERNGEQRRTKVSFGRTMIQALELQRLAKRHILGRSDVEQ